MVDRPRTLIGVRLATFNLLHGRSVRDGIVDPERLRIAERYAVREAVDRLERPAAQRVLGVFRRGPELRRRVAADRLDQLSLHDPAP